MTRNEVFEEIKELIIDFFDDDGIELAPQRDGQRKAGGNQNYNDINDVANSIVLFLLLRLLDGVGILFHGRKYIPPLPSLEGREGPNWKFIILAMIFRNRNSAKSLWI